MQRRAAHAPHFPNRRARLAEYAERRQELMGLYEGDADSVGVGLKRRRRLPNAAVLEPIVEEPEETMQACRLIWGKAGADIGCVYYTSPKYSTNEMPPFCRFKFDPNILREVLFPDSNDASWSDGERNHQPRKRRRTDVDDECTLSRRFSKLNCLGSKEIILENDADRYLVSRYTPEGTQEMDVDDAIPGRLTYQVSLFPRLEGALNKGGDAGGQEAQKHKDTGLVPVLPPIDGPPSHSAKQDSDLPLDPSLQSTGKIQLWEQNNVVSTVPVTLTQSPTEAPFKPPLHVIATDIGEGDILFIPEGIRIARGKIVEDLPPGVDDGLSKLDWLVKVARWKWREPSAAQTDP